MIHVPEVTIERIAVRMGTGESLTDLALAAVRLLPRADYGAVIAATFSNPERFPALSIRIATALGLPPGTPAFDLQLACSAYPYAVYLASRLAGDTGKPVLVIDGDVQSRLVDTSDHATGHIFSDAVTASVVSVAPQADAATEPTSPEATLPKAHESVFDFLSKADEALTCGESGPIKMDGFKVFSFVATEVSSFLRAFGTDVDVFAPHQANPYMVRQLAKSLGLADRLLTIDEAILNPGSCSVALALATLTTRNDESPTTSERKDGATAPSDTSVSRKDGATTEWSGVLPPAGQPRSLKVLIAGFGAGYSAAAGIVRIPPSFCTYGL